MSSPGEVSGRTPPKLHNSVGVMGIAAGSLLLAIEGYAPGRFESTALGLLLLVVSALLAFAAIRRLQCEASVFVNLCLLLSALWAGQGVIMVLIGQGPIGRDEASVREALVPGFVAFAPATLIVCFVGLVKGPVLLAAMSGAVAFALSHRLALLYAGSSVPGFGSSGVAASYLVVSLVGLYYGVGRIAHYLSRGALGLPGTAGSNKQAARGTALAAQRKRFPGDGNETAAAGCAACALTAAVLGCRALGFTAGLSGGQVPWLGAAFALQLLVSVLSFRSNDALGGVFFALASLVSSGAGLQLGLWAWHGGGAGGAPSALPPPAPVVLAVLVAVVSLAAVDRSLAEVAFGLVLAASCVAVASRAEGFLGVPSLRASVAVFVVAVVLFSARLFNAAGGDVRVPVGRGLVTRLVCRRGGYAAVFLSADHESAAPVLGYSRYTDAESLGHACNALAAFGMTLAPPADAPGGPLGTLVLPWVVVAGGLLQFAAGAISFSRGKTLESTAFVFYSLMWLIWGVTRYAGLAAASERGFDLCVGVVCFMVLNVFVALGAVFLSRMWVASALCFELIMVSFLLEALGALPRHYDVVVTVVFGAVSCYCFAASLSAQTLHRFALPAGRPWARLGGPAGGAAHAACPHLSSRKASSVQQIAEIMKSGGTCGVPTDTVYVLVAACNRPDAVRKAYKTKRQAEHRPMSLWISGTHQLEAVRHLFSPLLWGLMEAAWPSSVSLVIKRGEWVDTLGMDDAASLIGTPDSIAVRYPDCTVTTQLIDLVGPIAVTSANPTGEADTTHHNQVYAKLGKQVDGVLCDGPSPENIASTVVDCTKIEQGSIKFFRVGLVPKSKVLQMFEEVRARLQPGPEGGISNVGFERDDEGDHDDGGGNELDLTPAVLGAATREELEA